MREIKFRMWIRNIPGFMVYRGIYDKNWYLHPKECNPYRSIEQSEGTEFIEIIGNIHENGDLL